MQDACSGRGGEPTRAQLIDLDVVTSDGSIQGCERPNGTSSYHDDLLGHVGRCPELETRRKSMYSLVRGGRLLGEV
jgi:hypothetical protein